MPELRPLSSADPAGLVPIPTPQVLLVQPDQRRAEAVWDRLRAGWGAEVELLQVTSATAAAGVLRAQRVSCAILDLVAGPSETEEGLAELRRLRDIAPEVPIVAIVDGDASPMARQALRAGAQDTLALGRLDRQLLDRSIRYAIERQESEHELRRQALHDPLTGLPNRAAFLERLRLALARPSQAGSCVAVVLVALDRFTLVNESLGHQAGDHLLALVGSRLRGVLREQDLVTRFGGDEFAVLCEDVTNEDAAMLVGDRLADAVAAPFAIAGTEVFLTASAGIAVACPAATAEALTRDAAAAARQAKAQASRRALFNEVMRTSALTRLERENALHRALERDELRVHYQPTISLRDGRICGAEALLRWDHPEWGLVSPAQFIPLAEETGLIEEIGAWVLDQACAQLARWRAADLPRDTCTPLAVSVNLSARQLEQPALVDTVAQAVARHGIPPQALVLELTESLLVSDHAPARAMLDALRALGVRLAIDDFGTGYASLAALKAFPADVVKIDRGFVAGVGVDPVDTSIVSAVIHLTHELGLIAVAEGIERPEQLAALRGLGCDIAQGFLFSPPRPVALVDDLLRRGLPT